MWKFIQTPDRGVSKVNKNRKYNEEMQCLLLYYTHTLKDKFGNWFTTVVTKQTGAHWHGALV